MVLLERGGHAPHHEQRLVLAGLEHLHHLETARQRGVLLDVLLVLAPGGGRDGAQGAPCQRGLEEVGGIASPRGAPRADQGMGLVDEQDDRLRRGLHLVDDRAQAVLELALHAGAGLQQPDVERPELHVLEVWRHIAARDAEREALDHRRLAHPRLTGEDGVVLAPAHQDVDDLPDLLVAARDRIDVARARPGREVGGKAAKRLLLAHGRRRDGLARLAGRSRLQAVARRQAVLRRALDDPREVIRECLDLDLVELPGGSREHVAQAIGLEESYQQVAASHLRVAEQEGRVHPALLHGVRHVLGEILDGRGAARQPLQRGLQVARRGGRHRCRSGAGCGAHPSRAC